MAQYYHILNWQELRPSQVATLAVGLPSDSRVKKKQGKTKLSITEMLLAMIVDSLKILIWQNTKDGHKNRNRPKSLFNELMGMNKSQSDLKVFNSIEEYEEWYSKKVRT